MELDEKIITIAITLALLGSFLPVIAQQEYGPYVLNASLSQPICIELSGNLSQGIFFTNTTTIGVQYPITNVQTENNATGNYWGPSFGSVYNVTACSGNTINVSVYQSACEHLKNGTVNTIYLTYDSGDGGQGGFIGNATSATGFSSDSTYFVQGYSMLVDEYKLVAERIWPVGQPSIFLRYWLDPWPNSAPTGVYNTTYKIKAVEIGTSPGSGVC